MNMNPPTSQYMLAQLFWLLVLAIPIATVAWTVTHEEVFREPRDFCARCSQSCRNLVIRKFFYLFTCEYCFSHWVTAIFLVLTHFKLLLDDWRGYVLSLFGLVWVSNIYMNLHARLRVELKSERATVEAKEKHIQRLDAELKQVEKLNGGDGEDARGLSQKTSG